MDKYAKDRRPLLDRTLIAWKAVNELRAAEAWAHGLSLRDYFAGQALVAMKTLEYEQFGDQEDLIAQDCYKMADALLKVRDGG